MTVKNVADSFETGVLDSSIWKKRQIKPHQIAFSNAAAHGKKSIVITTVATDGGEGCDTPCQRAELRLHGNLRPDYGEEVWYSFWFKVSGDIQPIGSNRTVIGQWKAPRDNSPFLAQRFDNGVFHITVQDGPNRVTVASAKGNPDRLFEFQDLIADITSNPSLGASVVAREKAFADLNEIQLFRTGTTFSAESLSALDTFRDGTETLTGLKANRIKELFEEFNFIQDLDAYGNRSSIHVNQPGNKNLPDPKLDWVNMVYRIKGGREDNIYGPKQQGEIDIWANG